MGVGMTNLTDRERESICDHLFESETAYLVELIFEYMPEDLLKEMGVNLTEDDEEEDEEDVATD
jgi:hypothetical protein